LHDSVRALFRARHALNHSLNRAISRRSLERQYLFGHERSRRVQCDHGTGTSVVLILIVNVSIGLQRLLGFLSLIVCHSAHCATPENESGMRLAKRLRVASW